MIATTASSEITRERILNDLTGAIDAGLTLPSYWYTDPTVYRMEQEAIFRHTWQYAGHASQLQSTGDRLVFRSGCIPIVVVRNDAGELDAFINLCRHRGHELALEGDTKRRKTLQCAYHGWTYNLDGTLRSAPRSTRERNFDKSKVGLLPARVDTWGPLVFVNPDEQGPGLAEQLGDLPQLAESRGLDFSQYELRGRASYEFACNWKILMDNNFECYHCAVAHGSSFAPFYDVDPAAYKIEIFDYTASQTSPIKPGVPDGRPAWGDFRFHYLWPNTFIVDHSIIFNVLQILPLAPDRSAMIFETHVRRGTSEDAVKDYGEFYTNVFMEDGAVVESVQRGHDSGVLPPGPLFLDSEQLLQNFQGLLLRALSNGRSSRNGAR
jgi:phenylpropionate dioxygenase-like ring-hydroxylating dioxygenase large terminal subunit